MANEEQKTTKLNKNKMKVRKRGLSIGKLETILVKDLIQQNKASTVMPDHQETTDSPAISDPSGINPTHIGGFVGGSSISSPNPIQNYISPQLVETNGTGEHQISSSTMVNLQNLGGSSSSTISNVTERSILLSGSMPAPPHQGVQIQGMNRAYAFTLDNLDGGLASQHHPTAHRKVSSIRNARDESLMTYSTQINLMNFTSDGEARRGRRSEKGGQGRPHLSSDSSQSGGLNQTPVQGRRVTEALVHQGGPVQQQQLLSQFVPQGEANQVANSAATSDDRAKKADKGFDLNLIPDPESDGEEE